jgi:hypothetical protein
VPVDSVEWQRLRRAQEIRNVIVHRAGRMSDRDHKLLKDSDLGIYKDQLFAGVGYCEALMKDLEAFVRNIHELNADRLEELRQQFIGIKVAALMATAARVPG